MSEAPLRELEAAAEDYRERRAAVDAVGEDHIEAVAGAHERFRTLLDRYADTATGSGDFAAYVEFQERVAELVEGLPDELSERRAFERALEVLDRRRLSAAHFDRAREALAPAADLAARLDERRAARKRYRDARRAVVRRVDATDDRIDDLERVAAFADVDFDAPVGDLRDLVGAYDDAVREAFDRFVAEASAREVIAFADSMAAYPLIPFPAPPDGLADFLDTVPMGAEPLSVLLEHADYSRSKLAHHVDDPGAFKAQIAGNRTYLESLDAEPLCVAWPPPPAAELRWRARELCVAAGRFAPTDAIAKLRDLRDAARDGEQYARLRERAVADAELGATERERLATGAIERDLASAREERERLTAALESHPTP